jgi:hypothetical protein
LLEAFFGELLEPALALETTDDTDFAGVSDAEAGILLAAGTAGTVDAMDAGTDDPLITACSAGLNLPVMPVRLFASVSIESEPRRYYSREHGRERFRMVLGVVGILRIIRRELDKAKKWYWPPRRT